MKNERSSEYQRRPPNPDFPVIYGWLMTVQRAGVFNQLRDARTKSPETTDRDLAITLQWFDCENKRVDIANNFNVSPKRVTQIATKTFRRIYNLCSFEQQYLLLQNIENLSDFETAIQRRSETPNKK